MCYLRRLLLVFVMLASLGAQAKGAGGPAPLRIGVIASYSGPYADYGRQFDAGMAVWLDEHGQTLGGRAVEIIRRDTSGAAPDLARRHAHDLIVREKVDLITGLDFSPNALAIAPVVTQGRTPAIIMNAAAGGITLRSPYMARVAFTVEQVAVPMAHWLREQGVQSAYTVVADYASGRDAEAAFRAAFTDLGGEIAGQLRTPMNQPDFAAYIQRIHDEAPESVFFFFPSGVMPPAFLKAWRARELDTLGIRLVATGEATDDSYLEQTGDLALDLITSHHYSYAHDSDLNRAFVGRFRALHGDSLRPNYFAVAAYDALAVLDAALERTQGDTEAGALMAAMAGMELDSPRGPIRIDPETRDITQTVYIRRTEAPEGMLVNTELRGFEAVKSDGTWQQ